MNSTDFRKELVKIMPGYNWTVRKKNPYAKTRSEYLEAEGIQCCGFSRLSTLQVARWERNNQQGIGITYEAKSSGFGKKAFWLSSATGNTLAQALRKLQTHYENQAAKYRRHASDLENARKKNV